MGKIKIKHRRKLVGFDIGNSELKIVWKNQNRLQVEVVQMPENMIKDGVVEMPHMMADFLKDLRLEKKIPKNSCGLVVPDNLIVCRNVTFPPMTEKQLEFNLPFEFTDYISDEPQKYKYDYSMQEIVYDEEGRAKELQLMAAAIKKETVLSYVDIFKEAGFKLRVVLPQEIALINIMKNAVASGRFPADKEYCIAILGHKVTRIYIFYGDRIIVSRNISIGGEEIDKAIAEQEHVDIFMARAYKTTNYNRILDKDCCRNVYTRIALEIVKVINFYRYNNRESQLDNIYLAGGTSQIPELCGAILEMTELEKKDIADLFFYGGNGLQQDLTLGPEEAPDENRTADAQKELGKQQEGIEEARMRRTAAAKAETLADEAAATEELPEVDLSGLGLPEEDTAEEEPEGEIERPLESEAAVGLLAFGLLLQERDMVKAFFDKLFRNRGGHDKQ